MATKTISKSKASKKRKSYPKLTIWQAEKRFDTAIKAISTQVQGTREVQDTFKGYKVKVGEPFYHNNKRWQFQVSAYCTRDLIIKENIVVPVLRKYAYGVRLRSWIKHLVDWSNNI